ncbi:hypothetical protein FB45DRAFT_914215 [Roridomyces roridus]|uniref:F-box domain-containing protein n=1 Tax=Roridomyces roridus TaxID=1738132 RepID=A0AAD7FQB6_9AGAR|nr:hypothetical protein FB45DRAFT_914215 [Roridomyces roridus]
MTTLWATSLPPEILGDIFYSLIPPVVLAGYDVPSACFPWVLTHVCRHWRNSALAFPKLWASSTSATRMTMQSPILRPMISSRLIWSDLDDVL